MVTLVQYFVGAVIALVVVGFGIEWAKLAARWLRRAVDNHPGTDRLDPEDEVLVWRAERERRDDADIELLVDCWATPIPRLPAGHPESLDVELDDAAEDWLAAVDADIWPEAAAS